MTGSVVEVTAKPAGATWRTTSMKLTLPYPVSANRYWQSFPYMARGFADTVRAALQAVKSGSRAHAAKLLEEIARVKPRAVTVPSGEAKAYKEEVAWRARAAGFRTPSSGPVALVLTLCPRRNKDGSASGTVLDLGNCLKVAEDALQGVVYENDKQVKDLRLRYGPPTPEGALIVEVEVFEVAQPSLLAEAAA